MRWRPFILSALAVTALLALAASAAGTRPLRAAGVRSGPLPSSLFDFTFTTLVIVAAVGLIAVARFVPLALASSESRRSFPARVLRSVAILFVGAALVAVVLRHLHVGLFHLDAPIGNPRGGGQGDQGGSGSVAFRWDELLVVVGIGVLLVLLVFALRPRATRRREVRRTETLAEAISESLDDVRTDPDLRRAIEAAYARMERALAATGVPRDPAEAPNEYLERALLAVDTNAGAARRLTELFERVKFSQHEPDASMRDDAIEALAAIRDELSAGSEVAA